MSADKHKQRAEEAEEKCQNNYEALWHDTEAALEAEREKREAAERWEANWRTLHEEKCREKQAAEERERELQEYADHFVNTCQIDHRQVAYTNADSEEWQECPVCEWKKKADAALATVERVREAVRGHEECGDECSAMPSVLAALDAGKGEK